ncbi:MAG: amino acid adenylation domain-containing protein, partial [Ferruginibacter sp.]
SQGLTGLLVYNADLFTGQTASGIINHFNELLKSVVKAPSKKVSELIMMSDAEKQQILVDFNDTSGDYPKDKTMLQIFEQQVKADPNATALVFEDKKLSYRQLNERANQLGYYLKIKGVKEEALVAISIERSLDMMIGILGILKAGAVYVPIDPGYPSERISFMLKDTAADILLTSSNVKTKLSPIEIIELNKEWEAISSLPITNPQIDTQPNSLAYIIYTSGSTGRPKGVKVTHQNVVSLVKGVDYVSLTNEDVLLSTGSFSFDATTIEYWGMLLNGGQLVLTGDNTLLDSQLLKAAIDKSGVTKMWLTSSWFNQVIETHIAVFENVHTLIVGGEKLSEPHIEKFRNTYPAIEIINGYGPTENTTFSLTYKINGSFINSSIPIGKPINNRKAYVLDQRQQLQPVGVPGEICLGGAGLSRGYLNRPELTAEKFINDPFGDSKDVMLYRTGDIGRWLPDGNIEYLGRLDEQVKIRGYRIELGEIEAVLQESGVVKNAVVLPWQNKEGQKVLAAYIVPSTSYDKSALINYLQSKLPEYMIPGLWVQMDQLPLTNNGKIEKRALPDPYASKLMSDQYIAPRNDVERKLATIWEEALELEKVGIYDDFFEMGGHSLMAIRLISAIRKNMQIDLPLNDIFIYPTIDALADNINKKSKGPLPPEVNIKYLVPLQTNGNKIPLYIVCGGGGTARRFMKFVDMMDEDQPVYSLQPIVDKEIKQMGYSMEEIANEFIKEIMITNPNGPYALSGHCVGGIIAFEMAKQLKERGKKVHMLAMFDTIIRKIENNEPATFRNFYNIPLTSRRLIAKAILKLRFETFLLRRHPRKAIGYKLQSFKSLIKKIKKKEDGLDELEYVGLEIFSESSDVYMTASRNYKLKPYDDEILLFYAKERYYFTDVQQNIRFKKFYINDSTKNLWQQYASSVSIFEVEGDHSDIFDTTHGNKFANILQQQLNKSAKANGLTDSFKREIYD